MSRRVLLGGLAACTAGIAYAESPTATELMAASHEVARFPNVRFKARLTIAAKAGSSRQRDLNGLAKIVEKGQATARLMRVSSPADMRGVATLTVDRKQGSDDLWVYLPSMRRVRRLVSSNRRDPWMGSDFSYGDIVGHEVADWHHRIVRRETVQDVACTVIDSTPLRENLASETGYSKRVTWVRNSDAYAVRSDFFDLAGSFLKSMEATDVRLLDKPSGKSQAMRVLMRTAKSESAIVFDDFRIDAAVTDAEVAPESLKQ